MPILRRIYVDAPTLWRRLLEPAGRVDSFAKRARFDSAPVRVSSLPWVHGSGRASWSARVAPAQAAIVKRPAGAARLSGACPPPAAAVWRGLG